MQQTTQNLWRTLHNMPIWTVVCSALRIRALFFVFPCGAGTRKENCLILRVGVDVEFLVIPIMYIEGELVGFWLNVKD